MGIWALLLWGIAEPRNVANVPQCIEDRNVLAICVLDLGYCVVGRESRTYAVASSVHTLAVRTVTNRTQDIYASHCWSICIG